MIRRLAILACLLSLTLAVTENEQRGIKKVFDNLHEYLLRAAKQNLPLSERTRPVVVRKPYTKEDVVAGKSATVCQAGFTGANCESPICYNTSRPLRHDGTINFGEMVDHGYSNQCTDSITFPVDMFMEDFFVMIQSFGGTPFANVYAPGNIELTPCAVQAVANTQTIQKFCGTSTNGGPGIWTLKLSSSAEGMCAFDIRSQTTLTVDGGFVQDVRDDNVGRFIPDDNQGISRPAVTQIPSTFVFNIGVDVYPVHPQEVHIIKENKFDQKYDLKPRYGCGYTRMTVQSYNCSADGFYDMHVIGFDQGGNMWQRVYDFNCEEPGSLTTPMMPTGTPPTQPNVTSCYNGGILNNGQCYCGEYFEGPQCDFKVCMNDGYENADTGKCVCKQDYSGDYCQHVQCTEESEDSFDLGSRALGFVVRSSQSMRAQMDQIVGAAMNISAYFADNHETYFQAWVLSVVQNNGILFTHEYDNFVDFINSLGTIIHPPTDTECDDALLLGVSDVIGTASFKKYQQSPVFIFSDGVANDDVTVRGYLLQQLSQYRGQMFFMMSDSASGRCNVDISSTGYADMRNMARFTMGLAVQTPLISLASTTFNIAINTWRTTTIVTNDLDDCRKAPAYTPFFVDESVDQIIIQATGTGLTPTITLPDQTKTVPTLLFQNGNLYIWQLQQLKMGGYLLNMVTNTSSSSLCQYRVNGLSFYNLFYGVSDQLTNDLVLRQPVVRQESHLVARMNYVYIKDPESLIAEATIWFNDPSTHQRRVLYASSGIWRDNCRYELYFGSFQCRIADLPLYITVYVTDANGLVVQRTTTGYCTAVRPIPPDDNCLNGGVKSNGTCVCPSHFIGNNCQQIVCENQGSVLFGACQCPPGFTGQFCETVSCNAFNPFLKVDFNDRSLTFLVHDSITTRSVIRTMNDAASRVLNDATHAHPRWLQSYQLLRFNDSSFSVLVDSPRPSDMINGIGALYRYNQAHSDYSCQNLDLWPILLGVIQDESISWGGIVYIFVYGTIKRNDTVLAQILHHVEINKMQINVVQASLNPCGQDPTIDGLMSLAQFTGGQFITASGPNAGNVMSSIPTQYMGGFVYENTLDDCSDATFIFPVDSGTQSFTAYIQADLLVDPVYTAPDGTIAQVQMQPVSMVTGGFNVKPGDVQSKADTNMPVESPINLANLWNDVGASSRMDHIIRSCDSGWESSDNHCWRFVFKRTDWQSARASCHADGASLATIYNQADQSYLDQKSINAQFWIGLNDIDNVNTWTWDQEGNATLSLSTTKYTHWAVGQPSGGDTLRCVSDNNANLVNGWMPTDCTTKLPYVCVKHIYDPSFEPGDITQNPIPRGIWKMRVKADGQCSVTIRAQSNIQLITSYTANVHDDLGIFEPIQTSDNNRVIVHATGIEKYAPNTLQYAHMYMENMTIVQAVTLKYRDGCMLNYMSQTFTCPGYTFNMLLTGIDTYGYLFQRILPVACLGGVAPNTCENGGVFYQGYCICPPLYFGEMCEIADCQNGGFPKPGLSGCQCAAGFTGRLCEMPLCTRNLMNLPDVNPDNVTLIVAFDGSNNGLMANVNVSGALTTVITNMAKSHPGWLGSFVGVVFRDKAAPKRLSATISTIDSNDFINRMTAEITNNPYTAAGNSRAVFDALTQALSDPLVRPRSFAFVITASSAEDYADVDQATLGMSNSHTMINNIFIGDTTQPGGGNDPSDPSVSDMFELAHQSGGASYQLTSGDKLPSSWSTIMSTLHHTYSIVAHHIQNCSNYNDYLQVGSNGSEIIVDLYASTAPLVKLTDPLGQNPQAFTVLSSKTNNLDVVSQLRTRDPGIWTINLDGNYSNPGQCIFNIRAMSDVEVLIAFTQDTGLDNGLHDGGATLFPLANFESNAVVAATTGEQLTYVQLFDVEERRLLWASPMIKRSFCAYPFISQEVFQCTRPSFVVAIDGFDYVGHPFRRMYTIHCQGYIPPQPTGTLPTPPPAASTIPPPTPSTYPTCDPSVPVADIIIAFDSSQSMPEEVYQQTLEGFEHFVDSFQLDENHTRIMMGTYDTVAHFDDTNFNSIHNQNTYILRLIQLQTFGYTGNNGNNIQSVFDYLLHNSGVETPFRAGVRKVLMIISSIGWDQGNFVGGQNIGFPDPTADANLLSKYGKLDFVPLGYGPTANLTQLAALSTKCLQSTNDITGLDSAINFLNYVICQPQPVCNNN